MKERDTMLRNSILFDINETVLNLALLKPKFKKAFGNELVTAIWFSKLLHASTVCSLTGVKVSFANLAGDTLDNVASFMGVKLSKTYREDILSTFANLSAHNDIKPALTTLRNNGYSTIAFSNSSLDLITKQIKNAGLIDYFDEVISVEETGSFKPDSRVYQYVAERLKKPINSLRLVATHDWDTHGAMSAGMLSAYIDRSGMPYHPRYLQSPIIATNMTDLVKKIMNDDKQVN